MSTKPPSRPDDPRSLEPFFRPQAIAVIGASADPARIGGRPVRYLKQYFSGAVYPVNPSREEVQGLACYPSVTAIGQPADLALLCVPAAAVPENIAACAAAGIRAAVIVGSGFAEIGGEGARLQAEVLSLARRAGMRLLGPNCLGVMDFHSGAISSFTIVLDYSAPEPGNVAIISQSGAFAAHAYALARQRGMGFSKWITTGNESDVDVANVIAYLADDPQTSVIMAYMEGCSDGARLRAALRRAHDAGKPLVAVKVGRSEAGARAALSHTAAISGADDVFDAVFRDYGVHRAHTIDEFFDVAYAASFQRLPAGGRMGIVTISGGIGGFMADRCMDRGLTLPRLPEPTARELAALLPFVTPGNPLDVTAQIINDPSLLERALDALFASGAYDAAAVFLTTVMYSDELREQFLRAFTKLRERYPQAVVALCMLVPDDVRAKLAELGYIQIGEPSRAIDTIAALREIGASLARPAPAQPKIDPAFQLALPQDHLGEHEAKALLAGVGLRFPAERLARDADEAAQFAAAIGFPVALKLASPDIAHKSDIGGVLLDIDAPEALRAGCQTILDNARRSAPNARIDGVLVAEMVTDGLELILGARVDATFGPIVMVGAGGVSVEYSKDVAIGLAPLTPEAALELALSLRMRPLLEGIRGRPAADLDALAQAVAKLSQVIAANAQTIESVEINPFILRAKGAGGVGVDALIVPAPRT